MVRMCAAAQWLLQPAVVLILTLRITLIRLHALQIGSLLPLAARDALYTWVSTNRHTFGAADSCRIPVDDEMERFVME
jgi:predicted DCC family thiol-disulfide oxidoreductase YuxK